MRRALLCIALLTPSVCLASGDPGVIWQALGGLAAYVVTAAVLVVWLVMGRIVPLRLILFIGAAVGLWYWFLNTRPPHHWYEFMIFLTAPFLFLIGMRRR